MIEMTCDRCSKIVPQGISGSCRMLLGGSEYVWHLCGECQEMALQKISDLLTSPERLVLARGRRL